MVEVRNPALLRRQDMVVLGKGCKDRIGKGWDSRRRRRGLREEGMVREEERRG